ncbi:DUF308 domain-containing protein [Polynucleobacter sp. 86C-FISCH]|uniref:HdeD family acid-resistance protein n=1 Tax=Polynucleobacter sp. 86C-FISCH TaxID=2689101 RepID=UPI001C0CA121|nr:DUF308 domain-containing protein [Polynucleobacter sp. 86C-FISCH]MBU3596732.1 DUF308 domain-containing protein [Polynucleobacter sp. 86C-FISCH]
MSITNNFKDGLNSIHSSILGDTVKSSGTLIALGALFAILGVLGLFGQTLVSVVSVNVLGMGLVIAGGLQFIYAIKANGWKSVTFQILLAIIYFIAGMSIWAFPLPALEVLTLWLGFAFFATGVLRLIVAFQYRHFKGWISLLISSLLSILMSILILNSYPSVSLWLPGFLISIEMLMQGWALLYMGITAHKIMKETGL